MSVLRVTDRQNGTGADAVVTGVAPDTTVTLHRQPATGPVNETAWATSGTRVDAGAIPVNLVPAGSVDFYWWYAGEPAGPGELRSNVVLQSISVAGLAIHERIMEAAAAQMAVLALAGIAQVYAQKVLDRTRTQFPCVILTIHRQLERTLPGDFQASVVGYPVRVVLDARDPNREATRGRLLLWRQQIHRAFQGKRLAGVAEVTRCDVEPDLVGDTDEAKYQLHESSLLLVVWARQARV